MKKFLFVASALLILSMQVVAQKYFDVYQNGKLTISIPATSVDSVGLTGSTMENRKVNFYRSDNTVNSFLVSTVDSIKIFRTGDEQLVYLGIVGFNQDLYIKPIDVLANSTAGFYTSYVSDLERKDGTLLYYAVDRALYLLSSKDFPTPLSSVNLVTFTDGLDQGSLMMDGNYYTDEQYLDAVNNRIRNTTVKGLPVTAYSLGMRGSDVSDYTKFQNNLKKLASSADKAFEVSSMSDVSTRLQEISNKIISISNRQNFSFKIPGQSNGTVIRFTFDGYSADNSKMYIEGTFNLANRSLNNVSYHGIKATSGSYIQGTQNGIFVTFTFTGMQREDGNGLIPQYDVCEYYKSAGSSMWQQNSEFSPSDNTQTTVTHSGAAIVLVLDCSNSLGSQFSNMKSYAQNFINRVANNTKEFKVEAPQNVTATLTDNLDVAISWDAVKHAEYYKIQRSSSQYGTYSTVSQWIYSTSWTDKNPLNGKNYYKVIAYGHGLESKQNTAIPIDRKLEAPNNVTATLTDDLNVTISWSGVKGTEYYVVQRSSSGGTYTTVSSNVTSTSWMDTDPLSGNNYYKVIAYGHGLESAQSSYVSVERKLGAPKNVTATPDDNFMITLNWDAVKGAEYYEVRRSQSQNGTYSTVANNVTSTLWTDESPMNGYNYYKVIAYGHGLESVLSAYTAIKITLPLCPDSHHPHLIDLGLPSGTMWACCNVGASKPEDYGGYYAWGETTEKSLYGWDTYIHCDGSYSTCHDIGKDIAGTQYDAATANWGTPWVMPSKEQMDELVNNCTYVWTTENGVNGYRFTGSNGASIFFPAAGGRNPKGLYSEGSNGEYWSSTFSESNTANAWYLDNNRWYVRTFNGNSRTYGLSVRPVCRN